MFASKRNGRTMAAPAGVCLGVLTAVVITGISAMALTQLILKETVAMGECGKYIGCVQLLAAWMGAVVASGAVKRRRVVVCVVTAIMYFGVLTGFTALVHAGQYDGILASLLFILCGCVCGIVIRKTGGKGRKTGHYRHKIGKIHKKI